MSNQYAALIEELKQNAVPYVDGAPPRAATRAATAIFADAASALTVLSDPSIWDGHAFRHAQTRKDVAKGAYNYASTKLELETLHTRCAELMSQHEPLAGLNVDREVVRQVLHYVQCGRLK